MKRIVFDLFILYGDVYHFYQVSFVASPSYLVVFTVMSPPPDAEEDRRLRARSSMQTESRTAETEMCGDGSYGAPAFTFLLLPQHLQIWMVKPDCRPSLPTSKRVQLRYGIYRPMLRFKKPRHAAS
jgi:hypothetical protein